MEDTICYHCWIAKEWVQVKKTNGNTEVETRNITKLICLKCHRIKKVIDREMV